MNLHARNYSLRGPFDLILCRNVLIYFQRAARLLAINRFLDLLRPNGLLLLGHSESLQGESDRAQFVIPTVYRSLTGEACIKRPDSALRWRNESRLG